MYTKSINTKLTPETEALMRRTILTMRINGDPKRFCEFIDEAIQAACKRYARTHEILGPTPEVEVTE